MNFHCYQWISKGVHGNPWLSMETKRCTQLQNNFDGLSVNETWIGILQHDSDNCSPYNKMQVCLSAAIAMIPATMQQQSFYEYITAADYCKLLTTSTAISKGFAPLGCIVMLSKCHGVKNAQKGTLKQQCSVAPCHLIAESGVHLCGNHKNKKSKSTVWSVALGHLANIQQRVVDMNPQVGNAEAHSHCQGFINIWNANIAKFEI